MADATDKPQGTTAAIKPASSAKPATASYADTVKAALEAAGDALAGEDIPALTASTVANLDALIAQLIAQPAPAIKDLCAHPDMDVAPFCITMAHDQRSTRIRQDASVKAAGATWDTACIAWQQAKVDYDFTVSNADHAMRAAVQDAVATAPKSKTDSSAHGAFLFFQMKAGVAAAVQAYIQAAAGAGTKLAGAVGDLTAAHVAIVQAIDAAQTLSLIADATTQQAFWHGVQSTRDPV